MDSSCIIFSCTILSESRLFVLEQFLQSFKQTFAECDLYVGLNYNTVPQAKKLIEQSGLNVVSLDYSTEELYSESDASGYQIALYNLKQKNKKYSNYWFIHTKGGVNSHSDYLRNWYIDTLISKRNDIEKFLRCYPDIGSYGKLGLEYDYNKQYEETDCDIPLFQNLITPELPYTHSNFFYIHTLYVMTCKPIETFFSLISDNWFTTKLDRYYFEGVFPFIVSRSGQFPYLENRISCTGTDLKSGLENWIISNKLYSYINLISLYKTAFNFNQLTPPYVNINS